MEGQAGVKEELWLDRRGWVDAVAGPNMAAGADMGISAVSQEYQDWERWGKRLGCSSCTVAALVPAVGPDYEGSKTLALGFEFVSLRLPCARRAHLATAA